MLARMDELELRTATVADVDALLPMIRELFRDESIAWDEATTRAALQRLLGDEALGNVSIALYRGGACGYAIVTWGFDLEYAGRDGFLTELFVVPELRKRGVATRLLARVEAVARNAGAGAVHLQVRTDNPDARRLYDRARFGASPRVTMSKSLRSE